MYPDRRPYATAVNHAGYLSKPVLPPVEALRILNSTVSIDAPRSLRRESSLAPTKTLRSLSSGGQLTTRGVLLFKPPSLETASPFAFKEKDYHKSQQVALNAQLSHAVEMLFKAWHRKVTDLLHYLDGYPSQCAASNALTVDAMENYFKGYRTTDVLPMTLEQLAHDFSFKTNPAILNAILDSPPLQPDSLRRTLDNLLNARHFLAPVEHQVQQLEPLASLALPDEPCEGEKNGEKEGPARGPVWLSKAAVALHEKFHYDPSEYALRELKKSDQPIERLEARVLETKEKKERAIDDELPGEALTLLTAQVDLSNDLLLMNKARMELVLLHSRDVRELKPLIDMIIDDARRSVKLLQGRIDRDFPLVKKDLESIVQDIQNTVEHINELKKADEEACKSAHKAFKKLEDDERGLWQLLLEIMQKIVNMSDEKDEFVRKEMRHREQRARELALANELLDAQRQYNDRLCKCEESLLRWSGAAEVYTTYVEAFVPKLLKKVHDAEEADQNLYNREAQEYIRRYEMFEYAIEEGRATRQVHVDRLNTLKRSKEFDVERAEMTLDPHTDKYIKELSEVKEQLDEAKAYIELLEKLEPERRSDVEPILQHVIVHNRSLQLQHAEAGAEMELDLPHLQPDVTFLVEGKEDISGMRATIAAPARGAEEPVSAVSATTERTALTPSRPSTGALRLRSGTESSVMATVAHPHIQARSIGINHEEAFLKKYMRFADDEQRAVETAAAKLRQSRNDVEKIGMKYDNVDYVRMLLGTAESN